MKSLQLLIGSVAFLSTFGGLSGCVSNPSVLPVDAMLNLHQATVATQPLSSSPSLAVKPPTRNRHTKKGQIDYNQDLQTAIMLCNSQAQQEYVNSARSSHTMRQISSAIYRLVPGAYKYSDPSVVAAGLMATQGVHTEQLVRISTCASVVGSRSIGSLSLCACGVKGIFSYPLSPE